MEYFKNWYDENQKFVVKNEKNTIEKYLNILGAFTYNSTKILNSFYYISFHRAGNQIFEFLKKFVISDKIDFDIMDTINYTENHKIYIYEFFNLIKKKGPFQKNVFVQNSVEMMIRIAYFCFLILLEQETFGELQEFLKKESCKTFHIIHLKETIHNLIHNQNQIHIPNNYKSRNIQFLTSLWQKNAVVYLYINSKISPEFQIEDTYFQYEGKEINVKISNADNFHKYLSINNAEQIELLNESIGQYEKIYLSPESNFLKDIIITQSYFNFFTNLFQEFTDFIFHNTDFKNKYIISRLRNIDKMVKLHLKHEKKKLLFSIGILQSPLDDDYINFKKYTLQNRKIEKHRLHPHDLNYFYFLDEDNLISQPELINPEDAKFYFLDEIGIHKSFIFIKNNTLFYKKFKVDNPSLNATDIENRYKKHCLKRETFCFNTFQNGFYKCHLKHLPSNILQQTNRFIRLLIKFNILNTEFKSSTKYILLSFEGLSLSIPEDNASIKSIMVHFHQKLCKAKSIFLTKIKNLPHTSNKKIFIMNTSISFSNNIYYIGTKPFQTEKEVENYFFMLKDLTMLSFLQSLNLEQQIIDTFIHFIFDFYTDSKNLEDTLEINLRTFQKANFYKIEKYTSLKNEMVSEKTTRIIHNTLQKKNIKKKKKEIIEFLQNDLRKKFTINKTFFH